MKAPNQIGDMQMKKHFYFLGIWLMACAPKFVLRTTNQPTNYMLNVLSRKMMRH